MRPRAPPGTMGARKEAAMNAHRNWQVIWSALALSLFLASSSARVAAEPEGESGARPGMEYTEGVLCTNPLVAKDLIEVIDDAELYLSWLTGYALSGHCVVWLDKFRLARKLGSENTTFDGRRAELWAVHVPHGEKGEATQYGIIFPAASTVAGMHP
jgi:hypothetical protein